MDARARARNVARPVFITGPFMRIIREITSVTNIYAHARPRIINIRKVEAVAGDFSPRKQTFSRCVFVRIKK